MLIEIKSDVFDISNRLKNIDNSYYIVFNTMKNKFEVHSNAQYKCSYCVTCPYDVLDKRLIDLVQKTKTQNIKKLLSEIEKENLKLLQNQQNTIKSQIMEEL